VQSVKEALSMLETGQRLENEGFTECVRGSRLSVKELITCAKANCYMTAQQSLDFGLIGRILR
jgi:hypothetical protein